MTTTATATARRTRSTGALPRTYIDRVDGTVGSIVGVARHIKHNKRTNEPELMSDEEIVAYAKAIADKAAAKPALKLVPAEVAPIVEAEPVASMRSLLAQAKDLKVKGYSKMNRDELTAAIFTALLAS